MRENSDICLIWKLSLIILVVIASASLGRGQDGSLNPYSCYNTGNYTTNSSYSINLRAALATLSNMTEYGFRNASVGQDPDRANAIAVCRADVSVDRCRRCVETAVTELVQVCPNRKQAIRWYEWCTLHFSNQLIQQVQMVPGYILVNSRNVSDPVRFRDDLTQLLGTLRQRAANGTTLLKAGAGSQNTSDSNVINALLQCVPTLTPTDCDSCLNRSTANLLPTSAQGARMLRPSCTIRYEIYGFYDDEAKLRELNVLVDPEIPNTPPAPAPAGVNTTRMIRNDNNTTKIVIIVVVPIAILGLILAVCAAIYLRLRKTPHHKTKYVENTEEISTIESLQYDFHSVCVATNNFANENKLGEGGFGAVYKGELADGRKVAVKRLSKNSGQGDVEFKNEVMLVAQLQHRNLVRLIGFSLQGRERILIYEFVPNSSLDKFLFDPMKSSLLNWQTRYQIIGGIAKGLVYLHQDSRLRIIHRDLKAGNVLLDTEMNPKISDFGTARLFGHDQTQGSTSKIVGTYGYMAPEYAIYGEFSVKSDVFSFGAIVLEIICGRKIVNINGDNVEDLASFAWKNWREGTAANAIDPVLMSGGGFLQEMSRCMHIALLCLQENASDRPTMNSVIVMLSSSTITLPVPSQPAFVLSTRLGPSVVRDNSSSNNATKANTDKSNASSQNEMTISDFYPR